MFKPPNIRPLKPSDLIKLSLILERTALFPPDMLEEMASPFFSETNCSDLWLVCEQQGSLVGFSYCVHEKLTEGTWNVLAIAVLPEMQNQGLGGLLMEHIEQTLKRRHSTTLLVETSSLSEYEGARKFYESIGYEKEAVIRDFYAKDDHKIVFWKSLS